LLASKTPRFGWRDILSRDNGVAAMAVAVAVPSAIGGVAVLAQASDNYTHAGFLGGLVEALVVGGVMYAVGAYVGASALWITSERERDYSPALVAVGACLGTAVGSAVVSPVAQWGLIGLSPVLTLLAAWGGARLACRPRFATPPRGWRRWGRVAGVVAVGVLIAGLVGAPRTDFPGASAPSAERRAWGVKTFGDAYESAEAYVRTSPVVRERLGTLSTVAPTEGTNRTAYSPGELMGEFTLELVGTQGTGVARVQFMHGSSNIDLKSYGFSGELKTQGETIDLPLLD
jgi:hypothetical protein